MKKYKNVYDYYHDLEYTLNSLQAFVHNDQAREYIKNSFPELHELLAIERQWKGPLLSWDDSIFRWEATKAIVRLLLNSPYSHHNLVWKKRLQGDPMFKMMNSYPVIEGFHKYLSVEYKKWEAAEPQYGFVELFLG